MSRIALSKVTSGQALSFSSKEQNAMIDAANAFKNGQDNFLVPSKIANTKPGIVDVQNISGETVDQYHYMVVEDFIFKPKDNEDGFKAAASFKVNIFDETNEKHKDAALVILLQPIKKDAVGEAMIVGSSQVRVNIIDEDHKYASLKTGETILQSSPGGPVSLTAQETGTGEKWAYGIFPIEITEQQFKVKNVDNQDTITCVTWDGETEGEEEIQVAMPWELQRTPFDGKEWHDITFEYQDAQHREGTVDDDEPEKIVLLPLYVEDDIIIASRAIAGGINTVDQTTDKQTIWLDANKGGRQWAIDDSEEEE